MTPHNRTAVVTVRSSTHNDYRDLYVIASYEPATQTDVKLKIEDKEIAVNIDDLRVAIEAAGKMHR